VELRARSARRFPSPRASAWSQARRKLVHEVALVTPRDVPYPNVKAGHGRMGAKRAEPGGGPGIALG
jgi:hypothetical protein